MDLPVVLEMPGGDAFTDVTQLFVDGAAGEGTTKTVCDRH